VPGPLRQLRAGAKLTQEELAEAAGLSPPSVSDLERVSTAPPARTPRGCWPARWAWRARRARCLSRPPVAAPGPRRCWRPCGKGAGVTVTRPRDQAGWAACGCTCEAGRGQSRWWRRVSWTRRVPGAPICW